MRVDEPILIQNPGEMRPWQVLAETTLSNDATADFTFTPGFDRYLFVIRDLIPATNATHLYANLSFDNGDSYNSSNVYRLIGIVATTAVGARNVLSTRWILTGNTEPIGDVTGESFNATMYVTSLGGGLAYPMAFSEAYWRNSNAVTTHICLNHIHVAGPTDAATNIRFAMSSGNLLSGKITLFGREKV